MPPAGQCKVCAHPEKASIDDAIRRGEPYNEIARDHGLSSTTVGRHAVKHLGEQPRPTMTCLVCAMPNAAAVNEAIAAGTPYESIGAKYDTPGDRVQRHAKRCMGITRPPMACQTCSNPDAMTALLAGAPYAVVAAAAGVRSSSAARCASVHWGIRRGAVNNCSVCQHPDIDEIDHRLARRPRGSGRFRKGETIKDLAADFGLPYGAMSAHAQRHVGNAEHEAARATLAVSRLNAVRQYVGAP